VKLGPQVERLRVIEEGVKPDDRVIVNGLQRVRPGIKVVPKLVDAAK
jgi:multidrug efflux pump subunit AcrA (membrane-fusion protein)